jgi:ribose-phosphate pyrophosphokinase
VDALKRASAKSINVVIPYYGYARQDRKRVPVIHYCRWLNLIEKAGAHRVITMDLAMQIQGFSIFRWIICWVPILA